MNTRVSLLLVTLAALCAVQSAGAQAPLDQATAGRRWMLAFPDTSMNTIDRRHPDLRFTDKCLIMVYSAVDTRVELSGLGYRNSVAVPGGRTTLIDLADTALRAPAPIDTVVCQATAAGVFRLDAEHPVVVYQVMVTRFGSEAWTPLPVEAWGTSYVAAGMPGEVGSDISQGGSFDYNRRNRMFHAVITVVAAYDSTRLTIVPEGQVWRIGCPVVNVLLGAGQAYQIESYVDTLTANTGTPQPDFAGSRIFATKPVGVISGNTRAQIADEMVGLGKNAFKNMLIEWLPPEELFGTEFVYLPTWDARRPTGQPGEDTPAVRRREYVRVYPDSIGVGSITRLDDTGAVMLPSNDRGTFFQDTRPLPVATLYRSSSPAQAMMTAPGVVRYAGTTQGWGNYVGAKYEAWGGYMVEMTPRERWASVAPFMASPHPAGAMEHYINVVVDSAHRNDVLLDGQTPFVFNRGAVTGTPLIWGTMAIPAGVPHVLVGRNGARFAGHVYGTLMGRELYTPNGVRAPDEPTFDALLVADYIEEIAVAYAYPLASRSAIATESDSLSITTTSDSCALRVQVNVVVSRAGLRSIDLENAVNARIVRQPESIAGASAVAVSVVPIDPNADASATVVVTDRSLRRWTVPFQRAGDGLVISGGPTGGDFGRLLLGDTTSATIAITNQSERPVLITSFSAVAPRLEILYVSTQLPITLRRGDRMFLRVRARAVRPRGVHDSLLAMGLGCGTSSVPLRMTVLEPCLQLRDIDFGAAGAGEAVTRTMTVCNESPDTLRFTSDPSDVIRFSSPVFSASASQRALIAGKALAQGECETIQVDITPLEAGRWNGWVYLGTNSRSCRDSARVVFQSGTASIDAETGVDGIELTIRPHPMQGPAEARLRLPFAAHARVALFNASGREVASLLDRPLGAGDHVVPIDVDGLAAGVYSMRVAIGTRVLTRRVVIVR